MRKIRKIWCVTLKIWAKKHWFWAILAKNGQFWTNFDQKRANFEFSTKNQNGHFFTFIKPRLHEKNQKNLMRGFLRKSGRTYVRTYGRTYGQAWIHRSPRFLETNNINWQYKTVDRMIIMHALPFPPLQCMAIMFSGSESIHFFTFWQNSRISLKNYLENGHASD